MSGGAVGVMMAVSLSAAVGVGARPGAGSTLLSAGEDTSLRALDADAGGGYVAGTTRVAGRPPRGLIERLSPEGGAVCVLWEGAGAPSLIRSNRGDLLFAAAGGPDDRTTTLHRVPKRGGPATELATFSGHARLGNV